MERWRSVREYAGLYEVSDKGRVRSARAGKGTARHRALKPGRTTAGYLTVALYRGTHGTAHSQYVHRLVHEAFVGAIPPGLCIHHINARREDNRLANLLLCSYGEHLRDKHNVCGEGAPGAKLTATAVRSIRAARKRPFTMQQLAARYHVGGSTISRIIRSESWVGRRNRTRVCGEDHGRAKLSEADVAEIRRLYEAPISLRALATQWGVSTSTVRKAAKRRTWRSV